MPNNAFRNLICKKTLREDIEDSDRRDSNNMWDRLESSTGCGLSVHSNFIVLRYTKYVLEFLNFFCQISYTSVL